MLKVSFEHTGNLPQLVSFPHAVALAPTNLSEVQESVSGVRVSWSPPSPLGKTTGYQIYYSSSNISGSISISSGSVDNYLVSLVDSGTSHNGTFSIIGTSSHLPSKEQTIVIGMYFDTANNYN